MGLLLLIRLALRAGPSRAAQKFKEAQLHGTSADRVREHLRRAVREILGLFVLITFALFLFQLNSGASEDQVALKSVVEALVAAPAMWFIYRIIRFVFAF